MAKLDALFGQGYAKATPAALAAYVAACASNLHSFMMAATAGLQTGGLADALAAMEEEFETKTSRQAAADVEG